jgi:hypothetical protein
MELDGSQDWQMSSRVYKFGWLPQQKIAAPREQKAKYPHPSPLFAA